MKIEIIDEDNLSLEEYRQMGTERDKFLKDQYAKTYRTPTIYKWRII